MYAIVVQLGGGWVLEDVTSVRRPRPAVGSSLRSPNGGVRAMVDPRRNQT